MKKVINKSKLIFYSITSFMFNTKVSNAQKFSEWDKSSPELIETQLGLSYFVHCEIYKYVEWIIIFIFLILLFKIIRHFNLSRKNKEQDKNKFKKNIKFIFYILISTLLLYALLKIVFSCTLYIP